MIKGSTAGVLIQQEYEPSRSTSGFVELLGMTHAT
jgi:hypothetical protein